jgi:diguanylate cyclase (GGDEF)-like protein
LNILIFNRNAEENKLILSELYGNDFKVSQADSRQTAISLLKENGENIIIADFKFPYFNGMDLINHVLASHNSVYPFIIFITEKDQEDQAIDCLGPVPGDFLARPIDSKELAVRMSVAERALALQKRMQANAEEIQSGQAMYDQLTSVLNRQAVYEHALAELNRAQREDFQIAIAMVEVMNLKEIYEEYGDEVRDEVVRFVARAARSNLRLYDLVGRWIGAKFLLVLPGVNEDTAAPIFKRIHTAITTVRVRVSDAKRIALMVRVGFTITDRAHPLPLYTLIEQANLALENASESKDLIVVRFAE